MHPLFRTSGQVAGHSFLHLGSDRSIKRHSSTSLSSILLVRRNIVVQLRRLLRKLSSHILTLRLLRLKLNNGRHQLEHLVLYLTVLFITSATYSTVSKIGDITHLSSLSRSTRCSRNSGVESFLLSVVGDLVDFVQEVLIGFGDVGEIVQVERGKCGGGFFFGVSSLPASDGDVVESSRFEDAGLAGLERGWQRDGESRQGENGKGLEMHVGGYGYGIYVM
jgi:hypothetical protein